MTRFLSMGIVLLAGSVGFATGPQDGDDSKEKNSKLYPRVRMETTLGGVVLELNGEKAPVAVINFIRYAEDGYYNGTIFHRVMAQTLIQGGGYLPNLDRKLEGLRPGIPTEWDNGLLNEKWTIAMSRRAKRPNSATSTFQINVHDNPRMDNLQIDGAAYTVFGKVVEGFDTIEKIRNTKTRALTERGGTAVTVPVVPVVIKSVKVINTFDRAKIEGVADKAMASLREEREQIKARTAMELSDAIQKIEKETGSKVITAESGLMYVDLRLGFGVTPKLTDTVSAHYTGWLVDGTEFQSTRYKEDPVEFRLVDTLPSWIEALQTMRVGGRRKLIAPSELGYGPLGTPGVIPPYATLIFDLELLGIVQPHEEFSETGKEQE